MGALLCHGRVQAELPTVQSILRDYGAVAGTRNMHVIKRVAASFATKIHVLASIRGSGEPPYMIDIRHIRVFRCWNPSNSRLREGVGRDYL